MTRISGRARASLEVGGYGEPGLIRISGDYTRDKSNPRGGHRLIPGLRLGRAGPRRRLRHPRRARTIPSQDVEAYGLAINAAIELSEVLTFRSITAWRKDDTATPIDFDALPAVDLDVPGALLQRTDQPGIAAAVRQRRAADGAARLLLSRRQGRHAVRRAAVHDTLPA